MTVEQPPETAEEPKKPRYAEGTRVGFAYVISSAMFEWAKEAGYQETLDAIEKMTYDYRQGYLRRQKITNAEAVLERAEKRLIQMQVDLAALKAGQS